MDLAFFRRARHKFDSRTPAPLDYQLLVATLHTAQGTSPTARAEIDRKSSGRMACPSRAPLVDILLAGATWRDAVPFQGGSFNRERAGALARPCKPK